MTDTVLTSPAGCLWPAISSRDDKRIVTTDEHGAASGTRPAFGAESAIVSVVSTEDATPHTPDRIRAFDAGVSPLTPTRSVDPGSAAPTREQPPLRNAAPIRDPDRYEILGEHGRGGLGRVSRAHDKDLGRDVAIKELLSRGHLNELRFAREAMITARLEHPSIVPVHEAGRWPDGTPFYAMKLVAGRPLRALIAERKTIDDRVGLLHHVIAVADAIAYAHGRNIIHRDLKPANVIVGDFGETVVIDWGLAKDLADPTDVSGSGGSLQSVDDQLTSAGSVLGTPAYMAPEQERGERVDQRADVFAIGAMLWELCSLTKVPPTDTRQRDRMLRRAGIDRDLVAIIDKALDPDRQGRYPDAGALAADLKAFKSGARITARDYSLPAMLMHWTRRHRTLAVSAIGFAVLVLASVTALAVLYRSSSRNADVAQQRLLKSYVEQGRHALLDNKSEEALAYLAQAYHRGEVTSDVRFMLARAAQPRLRTEAVLRNPAGRLWSAIFSPDNKRIVTTDDHGARVWDARTRQPLFELPHTAQVYQADYGRDGAWIVTAGMDGDVKVWSSESGVLLRTLHHRAPGGVAPGYVRTAVSHHGALVATVDQSNGAIHVWDVAAGSLVTELPGERSRPSLVLFSSDDRWLATLVKHTVTIFDTHSWQAALTIPASEAVDAVFDPTGPRLLVVTSTGDASIWAVPSGIRLKHLLEAGGRFGASAFSPDGARVATSNLAGVISVWQTASGQLDATFDHGHGVVTGMEFDPSSKRLASSHADRTAVVSDIATGVAISVLQGSLSPSRAIHFDSTGNRIIDGSWDGTAHIWDASASYRQWGSQPIGRDCGITIMPDDERRVMAVSCSSHLTRIWDSLRGILLAELPGITDILGNYHLPAAVVSPRGDLVAIPLENRVGLYQLPGGTLLRMVPHAAAVSAVAFSPDGRTVASGSIDGAVFITRGDQPPLELPRLPAAVEVVGILADGRAVAADERGQLHVYARDTYETVANLEMGARMRAFRASADGRRLLTIRYNKWSGPALLWDLDHYRRIAALGDDKTVVFSARFEHGDRRIMTASTDGAARSWDGVTGKLIQSYVGTPVFLTDAATSPDGTLVVTAAGDGVVRFWGASSGTQLWSLPAHADIISSLHFEGIDLVTRGFAGDIARWTLPALPPVTALDSILRCLPIRFDDETGTLVEQAPCARPFVRTPGEQGSPAAGSRP